MTTGEKLAQLRKEKNYTQEQLAAILGVSRQSVSKWETDMAYPETDKLIQLGALYGCSMDYLLKENCNACGQSASGAGGQRTVSFSLPLTRFEKKSKKEIHGVPLWHINMGFGQKARGIIAIGFSAQGVISIGLFSLGGISVGLFSVGLLAFGVLALGLCSAGSLACGVLAAGALSLGIFSVGAASVGDFSIGALAVGKYFALGDHAYGTVAIGKTLADGAYTAPSLAAADPDSVFRLLDESVPAFLSGLKELIKLLF